MARELAQANGTSDADVTPGRPNQMEMTFQRGMLKTLGINLYANIGKVLVEFIANSYDSDATRVAIKFPSVDVARARKDIQDRIKSAITKSEAKDAPDALASMPSGPEFDGLLLTLPDNIEIVIEDDGHGMTWQEVKDKFLQLNRQRRLDSGGKETHLQSPNGRFVMGRKGVGKLAGFGAAEIVMLRSKRAGDTYATLITMTDSNMETGAPQSQINIPVSYEEGLPADEHGTRITLKRLKVDAFKPSLKTISDTIANAFFAIKPEDFAISINDINIQPEIPDYEYIYPDLISLAEVKAGTMVEDSITVDGVGEIPFRYYVGFRKRSEHLPAAKRGARVYCNNRLAAGPTLFSLGTGMHSFHSADYMECIVEADAIDRGSVDLISTSRTQLQEGNDVFDALQDKISGIMRLAIGKHGAFREMQADAEIDADPTANIIRRTVDQLPKKARNAAKRLLSTIAAQYGVGTTEFEELAPIILNSVNATDVLARLVSTGTKPETVSSIMSQLRELSEIEMQDVLKLYRGRRGGINKLQLLQEQGHELWKTKGLEKELHLLLKDNPWLIRPEFSTYLTSDERLGHVVGKLAKHLSVDKFSPIMSSGELDITRPDLVFLMSDRSGEGPFVVKVVELKSPSLPLNMDHFRQLEDYIAKVARWCRTELRRDIGIQGFLIGEMPDERRSNEKELSLLDRFRGSGPDSTIKILGLTQMITDTQNVHLEAIRALEDELREDDVD